MLSRISALPRGDRWQALARAALRYDLYAALEALTVAVLTSTPPGEPNERITAWEGANAAAVSRAASTLDEIGRLEKGDLASLSVALRTLRGVVRATELRTAPATSRPPAPPTLGWCPHSVRSSPRTAPWSRPTSSGCTCSSATGRCSRTSRSRTSCSGSGSGTATGGWRRRTAGRAPVRPSTTTTSSGPGLRAVAATRSTSAFELRRVCRERDPEWHDDVPVREEAIPVVQGQRVLAVVTRHTNLAAARTPSRLELTYLQCADDLARMIASGGFPVPGAPTGPRRGAPRVGDGLVRLDREGRITYASPNALSALHRLGHVGDVVERSLAEIVTGLLDTAGPVDESLPLVLSGRAPWRSDVEARRHHVVAAGHSPDRGRAAHRRPGAGSRRVRAAPARARADHQGRDDPRGPPPGEEQPADRRRTAPAAGPADPVPGGAGRPPGGDAEGGDDRARARDALGGAGRHGRLRRRARPLPGAGGGGGGRRGRPGADRACRHLRGDGGGERHRRSRSSSPSSSPTPSSTGSRGRPGTVRVTAERSGDQLLATVGGRRQGTAGEVRAGRRRARHADRAGAGGGRAAGADRMDLPARGRNAGHRRCRPCAPAGRPARPSAAGTGARHESTD